MNTGLLSVRRTDSRKGSKVDYLAVLHRNDWKKIGYSRFGVVSYKHPIFQKTLRVPCKVLPGDKYKIRLHQKNEDELKEGEVALDQSFRNALGMRYQFSEFPPHPEVTVSRLRIKRLAFLRERLSIFIFGRRYLFLRVCRAFVDDMEKGFCRIEGDSVAILGTEFGGKIRLEHPGDELADGSFELKSHRIKTYQCSDNLKLARKNDEQLHLNWFLDDKTKNEAGIQLSSRREKLGIPKEIKLGTVERGLSKTILDEVNKTAEGQQIRYENPELFLGLDHEPDIARIFLDYDTRKILSTDLLYCVRAKRDVLDQFFREFISFGILFFVAVLALVELFPLLPDWLKTSSPAWNLLIGFGISLIASILVVLIAIRSKIK
jgi:hypothetical protein